MLHKKNDAISTPASALVDDIYASPKPRSSCRSCASRSGAARSRTVYAALHDELMLDGNSRQTWRHFAPRGDPSSAR